MASSAASASGEAQIAFSMSLLAALQSMAAADATVAKNPIMAKAVLRIPISRLAQPSPTPGEDQAACPDFFRRA